MDEARALAQAASLSQGLMAEGTLRNFNFSIDLKSFQAGSRLPLNLAAVVLELCLPPELAGIIQQSNGRLPPRLAPLRTQAVQVARSSEAALPGGQANCDFTAGLMSVATLLARGLVMTIDVFHKERLTDDLLLGRAHVPLAPLLQESWVDGKAGVFALVPSTHDAAQHERVQIGTVHLVMSLEEAGPAAAAAVAGAAAGLAAAQLPAQPLSLPAAAAAAAATTSPPAAGAAVAPPRMQPASAGADDGRVLQQKAGPAHAQWQQQLAVQPPAAAAPAAHDALGGDGIGGGPEFEAAWELELWKRSEEASWRQELKARESKRMAALEEAWHRREQERATEAAQLRSEYAALEGKARQVLAAAEERERKVVAAEETAARRRRELEREHAGRVAEAEAAVRRLQAECQHQLELEQQRREQAQQQKAAAEQRAAAAEARGAAADSALQQLREQHSSSEAGRVEAELAAAHQGLVHAEQRVAKSAETKRKYKQQVVRLAQEVALLQQQLAEVVGLKREQLDAELAKLQADEQALAARRDASEMAALKQQLHSLQMTGSGGGGGTGSVDAGLGPFGTAGTGGAGNKENGAAACGVVGGGGGTGAAAAGRHHGGVLLQGQLSVAVQRLLRERELLLSSGAYSHEDPLIHQLDRRIKECAALAQTSSPGRT